MLKEKIFIEEVFTNTAHPTNANFEEPTKIRSN